MHPKIVRVSAKQVSNSVLGGSRVAAWRAARHGTFNLQGRMKYLRVRFIRGILLKCFDYIKIQI